LIRISCLDTKWCCIPSKLFIETVTMNLELQIYGICLVFPVENKVVSVLSHYSTSGVDYFSLPNPDLTK
jgi:hypothetical protein